MDESFINQIKLVDESSINPVKLVDEIFINLLKLVDKTFIDWAGGQNFNQSHRPDGQNAYQSGWASEQIFINSTHQSFTNLVVLVKED